MKLLFYIFSLTGGGAERVTANLANYWAGKGWNIVIVTPAAAAEDAYELDPAITRISLNMPQIGKTATGKLWKAAMRARALRRVLLDIKPDVALAMMDTSCATLALGAWGLSGVVPVGSLRLHPPCEPTKAVFKVIQSFSYRTLPAVLVQTQQTAAWLAANTIARRIDVIPNPVSWPLTGSGPKIDPDGVCRPGRKLLLAAGRLVPQKGFDLLIDAFAGLSERHHDWDLAIIGEGAGRQRLEREISQRGMEQRVFLPGWAGNIPDWYRKAHLYTMTSRYEGFPNSLAEAMAHGLPAVSFDCATGPKDIIRDGIDGFLAPKEDVPALAACLDRLMADPELRDRFGTAAMETRDRFSLQRIAQKWESVFEELLAQRRPGRVEAP